MTQQLRRLGDAGQIAQARQYRYRFFRLAYVIEGHSVARKSSEVPHDIRFARSCYGHLAGWLGVTVTRALVERKLIVPTDDAFDLTLYGQAWLEDRGIELTRKGATRRRFARSCLDWTEKQPHLAGIVGEALLSHYVARGWLARKAEDRTLDLTVPGRSALESELGLSLS